MNLAFTSQFAENQQEKGSDSMMSSGIHCEEDKTITMWALSVLALSSYFFNMQDSYSSTDIKLVLLDGFLVMHVQKASFASNLNFCFPLVTHFAASVFIL